MTVPKGFNLVQTALKHSSNKKPLRSPGTYSLIGRPSSVYPTVKNRMQRSLNVINRDLLMFVPV